MAGTAIRGFGSSGGCSEAYSQSGGVPFHQNRGSLYDCQSLLLFLIIAMTLCDCVVLYHGFCECQGRLFPFVV